MKNWGATLKTYSVILPKSYFAQLESRNDAPSEMANVLISYRESGFFLYTKLRSPD